MELDYILKRTKDHKTRYYYNPDDPSMFFMSVTTWQKQVLPMSPGLLAWIKKMTPEEQDQVLLETSEYGTFFHTIAKEYTDARRTFPITQLNEYISGYRQQSDEPLTEKDTLNWQDQASNDLYALNQFFMDRNVEPLRVNDQPATEIALAYIPSSNGAIKKYPDSDKAGFWDLYNTVLSEFAHYPVFPFAGALDLVCELDWQGKRITAIVDLKTGRIWPNHPYQLEAYKLLWNHNFPECPVEMIFNWRPKDWNKQKEPTYQLKNQTDEISPQVMANLYSLAQAWCNPEPKPYTEYTDIQEGYGEWHTMRAHEYYREESA